VFFVHIVFLIPNYRVLEFDIIPQTFSNCVALFEALSKILNSVLMSTICDVGF